MELSLSQITRAIDTWDGDALVTKNHAKSLIAHLAKELGFQDRAEMTLATTSQTWPGKLAVAEEQLVHLKAQALQDGVSEEYWDKWAETHIEVVRPWEGGE